MQSKHWKHDLEKMENPLMLAPPCVLVKKNIYYAVDSTYVPITKTAP